MSNNINKVLVVGTGYMAREYIKVLKGIRQDYVVVGNRKESVEKFRIETGEEAFIGGIDKYINSIPAQAVPMQAIVAVTIGRLYDVTMSLLKAGVKRILVEKPGAEREIQLKEMMDLARQNNSDVFIAYNRRFYSSVRELLNIAKEDGGIDSVYFEFTEWANDIESLPHPIEAKHKWFLMNSSHVADLAFYLAGFPKEMYSFVNGGLSWHPCGSNYVGCGMTDRGIPFNYQANWDAPGRWGVEVLTKQRRLYLRPMEKLFIQKKDSVAVEEYVIDDSLDIQFKAGLYEEVSAFLNINDGKRNLCTLEEQLRIIPIYSRISGEKY